MLGKKSKKRIIKTEKALKEYFDDIMTKSAAKYELEIEGLRKIASDVYDDIRKRAIVESDKYDSEVVDAQWNLVLSYLGVEGVKVGKIVVRPRFTWPDIEIGPFLIPPKQPDHPINSKEELSKYLHGLADDFVKASKKAGNKTDRKQLHRIADSLTEDLEVMIHPSLPLLKRRVYEWWRLKTKQIPGAAYVSPIGERPTWPPTIVPLQCPNCRNLVILVDGARTATCRKCGFEIR